MIFGRGRRRGTAIRLLAGCATLAILAGCQSAGTGPVHTGSINSSGIISPSDLNETEALAAVQTWGAAYSKDPTDKIAAMNYSAALRAAGETSQAVAVMRKAAIYHPEDREVLAAFGKALAADGQFREALATVQRAQRPDNPDWQLLATEGAILDSLGQYEDARSRYRQALVLAPGEPQILNNLGLSYLLTNELEKAEAALREAAASPNATRKVHENLALVLRLREGTPAVTGSTSPGGGAGETNTWAELAKT